MPTSEERNFLGRGNEDGGAQNASNMPGYEREHFGLDVNARAPLFRQGVSANPYWQCFNDVEVDQRNFTPCRTLVMNIPVELFDVDGTRFRHWSTPQSNGPRAQKIAAFVGMLFTGTSKGFSSGRHEETQRANGQQDAPPDPDQKNVKRATRYFYVHEGNNNVSTPMFVIGLEELYNREMTEVTVVRVWKFVFDKEHSDSELWRKVMDESASIKRESGLAHSTGYSRKKNMVDESRHTRVMGGDKLEIYAGTQYASITNETELMNALKLCSGMSQDDMGKPTCDMRRLPPGVNNRCIVGSGNAGVGGMHPLGPEYQFNARRQQSLSAWQIHIDGAHCDVHPSFNDPSNYFSADHSFKIPEASMRKAGFFLCIDPNVTNIFDLTMPRPIYGKAAVGPHLLQLFKETHLSGDRTSLASDADLFRSFLTGRDPQIVEMETQATEAVVTFDAIGLSEAERRDLRHYGEMDAQESYIMEPKQVMKDLQIRSRKIVSDVIKPWLRGRELEKEQIRLQQTNCGEMSDDDVVMDMVDAFMDETQARHQAVMRDAILLHLNQIEEAFESRIDRASIPAGYCAMYDYLKAVSSKHKTASIAWVFNKGLTAHDTSAFSQMFLSVGEFFERDCFSKPQPSESPRSLGFH